jgi:hypothetical protein
MSNPEEQFKVEFLEEKEITPPGLDSHVYSWNLKLNELTIPVKATCTGTLWAEMPSMEDAIEHLKTQIAEYLKENQPTKVYPTSLEFQFSTSGMNVRQIN